MSRRIVDADLVSTLFTMASNSSALGIKKDARILKTASKRILELSIERSEAYAAGHAAGIEAAAKLAEEYSKPFAIHTNTGAMMFRATTEKLAMKIRSLPTTAPEKQGGSDAA